MIITPPDNTKGEYFFAGKTRSQEKSLQRIKVASFGLGPIGRSIALLAASREKTMEIVGAVDSDPSLKGKSLREVIGVSAPQSISVASSLAELAEVPDVVLHATGSFLSDVKSQLLEFCRGGIDVVSTNEELSYPWFSHREIGLELDKAARDGGCTILGTGVNPGFVLDALAITLSGACENILEANAVRVLDATRRRLPFQKKVGIGMDPEEFEQNVRSGKFGHIGMPESMAMVCDALGKPLKRIDQRISPKIAEEPTQTDHFGIVRKGRVLGLVQDGHGYADEARPIINYHIEMYAGAKDAFDEIEFRGNPNLKLRIPGGTPGDIATTAMIVNSVKRVVDASPGLLTVKDLRPANGHFS